MLQSLDPRALQRAVTQSLGMPAPLLGRLHFESETRTAVSCLVWFPRKQPNDENLS